MKQAYANCVSQYKGGYRMCSCANNVSIDLNGDSMCQYAQSLKLVNINGLTSNAWNTTIVQSGGCGGGAM